MTAVRTEDIVKHNLRKTRRANMPKNNKKKTAPRRPRAGSIARRLIDLLEQQGYTHDVNAWFGEGTPIAVNLCVPTETLEKVRYATVAAEVAAELQADRIRRLVCEVAGDRASSFNVRSASRDGVYVAIIEKDLAATQTTTRRHGEAKSSADCLNPARTEEVLKIYAGGPKVFVELTETQSQHVRERARGVGITQSEYLLRLVGAEKVR